jgi:lipopolysaccharide export LptBFGC system permease protein LptF
MKNKTLLKMIAPAAAIAIALSPVASVLAESEIPTSTVNTIQSTDTGTTTTGSAGNTAAENDFSNSVDQYNAESEINNQINSYMPNVSSQEVTDKITSKAYQVADTVRKVAIPILIITFVISVFSFIWGALSVRKTTLPGILGMIFCGVGYVLILYAPQILSFFGKWLWS